MYLIVSMPSRCLFLWTGPETEISLEHGLIIGPEAINRQSAIFRLEDSFGKGQSYFLPLPPIALKMLIHAQKIVKHTLRGIHRYHRQALPVVAWTSVLAIVLFTTQRGKEAEAHNSTPSDANTTTSHTAHVAQSSAAADARAAEGILRETKAAFGPEQPYANLQGNLQANQPGVTQLTIAWPQQDLRESYAVIPAYDFLSHNLAVSIELPFRRIFVYLYSGSWEMKLPSRDCPNGQQYQMNVLERVAIAFEADRSLPGTKLSLAQIPPNHTAPGSCHSDLLEQW